MESVKKSSVLRRLIAHLKLSPKKRSGVDKSFIIKIFSKSRNDEAGSI
jgi:hypothetical protein